MSGKEILVDTNIILYLLEGSDTLVEILQGKDIYLSFITELELIGYKNNSPIKEDQIAALLNDCSIISMNSLIKEKYVEIRKKHHLKLADAIIAATAMAFDMPIITADKHFRTVDQLKLIAYQHKPASDDPKK
jgi:predicted nucleic acid-binding protein